MGKPSGPANVVFYIAGILATAWAAKYLIWEQSQSDIREKEAEKQEAMEYANAAIRRRQTAQLDWNRVRHRVALEEAHQQRRAGRAGVEAQSAAGGAAILPDMDALYSERYGDADKQAWAAQMAAIDAEVEAELTKGAGLRNRSSSSSGGGSSGAGSGGGRGGDASGEFQYQAPARRYLQALNAQAPALLTEPADPTAADRSGRNADVPAPATDASEPVLSRAPSLQRRGAARFVGAPAMDDAAVVADFERQKRLYVEGRVAAASGRPANGR